MPRWTQDDLRAFDERQRNAHRAASQSPQPEPAIRHEPVAEEARKGGNPGRFQVRIVSFRGRLLDPDNLCAKYFIDCLRYSEIIPDDRPQDIELSVTQIKVANKSDERTEITVTKL